MQAVVLTLPLPMLYRSWPSPASSVVPPAPRFFFFLRSRGLSRRIWLGGELTRPTTKSNQSDTCMHNSSGKH